MWFWVMFWVLGGMIVFTGLTKEEKREHLPESMLPMVDGLMRYAAIAAPIFVGCVFCAGFMVWKKCGGCCGYDDHYTLSSQRGNLCAHMCTCLKGCKSDFWSPMLNLIFWLFVLSFMVGGFVTSDEHGLFDKK